MNSQDRQAYIDRCEAEIEQIKEFLKPIKDGTLRFSSRTGDGPWIDTTDEIIARDERTIRTYEGIIAKLKANEL